jgi:hypothetical protein
MIMSKLADQAERCLLVDILLHAEQMQRDEHWITNLRSWFALLFDQPDLNREICKGGDDDDDDDDDNTGDQS